MEMNGEQLIAAPQQRVWDTLNDPAVLKDCIAGCESVENKGENQYEVLMTARVGPVSAKFRGKLTLSDIHPPHSYSLAFDGQGGAAGFGKGGAKVMLTPETVHGASGTRLAYQVQAHVGGKLAQIGSRLVDMAAKKIADDFFTAFNARVAAPADEHDHAAHDDHRPEPVPRDPDLPAIDDASIAFFAGGALLVFFVSLITLL
jgi:carbon monoxide dehydrogenase subunit G